MAPEILLCWFLGAFVIASRLSAVTSLALSRVPLQDGGDAGGLNQGSSSLFLQGLFSISALSGTSPPPIFWRNFLVPLLVPFGYTLGWVRLLVLLVLGTVFLSAPFARKDTMSSTGGLSKLGVTRMTWYLQVKVL